MYFLIKEIAPYGSSKFRAILSFLTGVLDQNPIPAWSLKFYQTPRRLECGSNTLICNSMPVAA